MVHKKTGRGMTPVNSYTLKLPDRSDVNVCRGFFANTLGEPTRTINDWLSTKAGPKKSKANKTGKFKKVTTTEIQFLIAWLDSLSTGPSHYCRKLDNYRNINFLEPGTTKAALRRRYARAAAEVGVRAMGITKFSETFKGQNFSLFIPRKDQCDVCVGWKAGDIPDAQHESHRSWNDAARAEKERDEDEEAAQGTPSRENIDMSNWRAFYEHRDEEDEEDEDERREGGFKSAGRDSVMYLVDASKEMFIKDKDMELSHFQMCMQGIRNIYSNKICASDRDLVAVVLFGTESQTKEHFKHVTVFHDLDEPSAHRIMELQNLAENYKLGHAPLVHLHHALWQCGDVFSSARATLAHRNIIILTNRDDPHGGDRELNRLAHTKAADLLRNGEELSLLPLGTANSFDLSLFYCDVISHDQSDGMQDTEPASTLDDLQLCLKLRQSRPRAQVRLVLTLGGDVKLGVGVYILVRSASKPAPMKLQRSNNEPVRSKTRLYHAQTARLMLRNDIKKAQTYGKRQIVFERDETDEVRRFFEPGLVLIGFKPLTALKPQDHVRPAQFLYPDESSITGSTRLFVALLQRCWARRVFALCRYTARKNLPPRFVALVPQEEEVDEHKVQLMPGGFHMIFLPFADDIRNVEEPPVVSVKPELVAKAKTVIQKLNFSFMPQSFSNPVLQTHFNNLEALALDRDVVDAVQDYTLPPTERIEKRAGQLLRELTEMTFPPNYKLNGNKKKSGESAPAKKPRSQAVAAVGSKEELQAMAKEGTVGRLTVKGLQDVSRTYGIVIPAGARKQELVDAISKHFLI
uniref:X-ray repair cross-complementing protein 6-like isoform X2 n=1 Tax=Myxine glutinosa TaxID=7769 RepID=UPI00358DE0F3